MKKNYYLNQCLFTVAGVSLMVLVALLTKNYIPGIS